MQNARVHCRGEESIASPPTIPVVHDARDISDASKPPRRKVLWQFDPQVQIRGAQFHGSQKNQQHDFGFWFAFPWFFRSRRFFVSTLCSATSARCRNRRSTIRHLWWPFPRIHRFPLRFSSQRNTTSVATFAQEWAVSVQPWRRPFSCPNVPLKSCIRTTFPNKVLLLPF